MKAYQPGLQQYINGLKPGTSCVENRQAYATGMADILEAYSIPPATAYDQGRMIALSMNMTSIEQDPIDPASFVAGAKASLGLGPQIIPRFEAEEILNRQFEQQAKAAGAVDYEVYASKLGEYINRLEIEPACPYYVDWKVTARAVAEPGPALTETEPEFVAQVHEATVELDSTSGILNVQWTFDEPDALKWAEFTEASIGKHVAVYINGKYMFAPRVNQRISGGRCAISDLTPEEINSLFKNAEKVAPQHPVDTIEIIDF